MTDMVNPFAEQPVEEAKQEPTSEEKYLAAVKEMNDILDGRLEGDVPLNDPYWEARKTAHAAHHVFKAAQ